MFCRNCGKKIKYGSEEACIYEDEIFCSDSCMLLYVDYGVPDYESFSKQEFDSRLSWTCDDNSNSKEKGTPEKSETQ